MREGARISRGLGAVAALAVCAVGCAHGLATPPPDDSPAALQVRLQAAVTQFRQSQRPGGAPDAPGLVRLASQMLGAHAVGHTFTGQPGDLIITLEPALDTALNRLALQVRDTVGGTVIYDVGRHLKEPDAAAHFDPATNVLYLPHAAIVALNADEPSIRHELVHVRTFGTLRTGWLSGYQGYLRADALGPDELFLDELNAYAEDVRFAASQLAEILRRDPDPAGRVARAELGDVLRTRIAGEKPQRKLSFLEQVWDRLVARAVYAGSLALPAAEVLLRLESAAKDPANVEYAQGAEGPMATVRAAVMSERGEPKVLTGRFHLPSSEGLEDPKNAEILAKQVVAAQQAAQGHAEQLGRAMAAFHGVVDEISPAKKAERLLDPRTLAGD